MSFCWAAIFSDTVRAPLRTNSGMTGPVVWWVKNGMRLQDNTVLRRAVDVANTDQRRLFAIQKFGCARYPHNMENGGIIFLILLGGHFQ